MEGRYVDDDGNEYNPDLIPMPSLCVTCKSRNDPDEEEQILCNLNRLDQAGSDTFECHAYKSMYDSSPDEPKADNDDCITF